MYLAKNLKYLREQNDMSQKSFSTAMGVSDGAVAMWETSKRTPDIEMIIRLAEYFDVSLDDLVLRDLRPPKPMYADNLKYFRKKYEITQREIGELLNVKQTTAANYEAGRREMPLEQIMKLADYFGITLDQFVKQDLSKVGRCGR